MADLSTSSRVRRIKHRTTRARAGAGKSGPRRDSDPAGTIPVIRWAGDSGYDGRPDSSTRAGRVRRHNPSCPPGSCPGPTRAERCGRAPIREPSSGAHRSQSVKQREVNSLARNQAAALGRAAISPCQRTRFSVPLSGSATSMRFANSMVTKAVMSAMVSACPAMNALSAS